MRARRHRSPFPASRSGRRGKRCTGGGGAAAPAARTCGRARRLENYPEYARVLQDHVGVTRGQLQRLEKALGDLGESASALKEAVTSLAGRIGATVHAMAQDETLKNLYAGYGYQYDQVAAYRSLVVFAETAGHPEHAAGFKEAVEEEKRGAQGVDAIIESVTRQYIERTAGGAKADS